MFSDDKTGDKMVDIFKRFINGKNNEIVGNTDNVRLYINGSNNVICFPKNITARGEIHIFGDNNHIDIEDRCNISFNLRIGAVGRTWGHRSQHTQFHVGYKTYINNVEFRLLEDDSSIRIGHSCMFANGSYVWCTDGHSIYDENGKLCNLGRSIDIGNNVWVGRGVNICKNTSIPDNCVVGCGSVVTKMFTSSTPVVIAGNPARICKHISRWEKRAPTPEYE